MTGMLTRLRSRLQRGGIATPDWADTGDEERQRAWAAYRDPDATETQESRVAKWKVRAMVASLPIAIVACTNSLLALSSGTDDAVRAASSFSLPSAGSTDFVKLAARDWLRETSRDVLDVEWRGWRRCAGRSACEVHTVHSSLRWDTATLSQGDLQNVEFLVGNPEEVVVELDVAVTIGTSPLSVIGFALLSETVTAADTPACLVGVSAVDAREQLPNQFLTDMETWAAAWVAQDQSALVLHANDPAGGVQDVMQIDGMRYISNSLCVQAVRGTDVGTRKIVTVSLQSLRECGATPLHAGAQDEVAIRNRVEVAAHPCGVPLRTEADLVVNIDGLNSHVVKVGPVGTIS